MKKTNHTNSKHQFSQHKLSRQLVGYTFIASIFLSVVLSCIQAYLSFTDDVAKLALNLENTKRVYSSSLVDSLLNFNEEALQQQLHTIVNLPDIEYVKLTTDYNNEYILGNENALIDASIRFNINDQNEAIGELSVYASYKQIYQRLTKQTLVFLAGDFVKSFLLILLFLVVVRQLILRHIQKVIVHLNTLECDNLSENLNIYTNDEFHQLSDSINNLSNRLCSDASNLSKENTQLLALNDNLEKKVLEKSLALDKCQYKLQHVMSDFTLAKDQLIQSEKMAYLGQLVTGVTREINKPLGICITSISALSDTNETLKLKVEDEKLTRSELLSTLDTNFKYHNIMEGSLHKAIEIINHFKTLTVEQENHSEERIHLASHIKGVVNTVKTLFKHNNYHFILELDDTIEIQTLPSAWNQMLTNLLINSHEHGFDESANGTVSITLKSDSNNIIMLYSDNGKGVDKTLCDDIFEPFVSSKNDQKSNGLGLSIVYNLVTHQLNGEIECIPTTEGVLLSIAVPYIKHYARESN